MEKHPRPTQLEAAIREIVHELLEMPVTPHVRELRAKAVTYSRVIGNWSIYPPTTPQVQAMFECVAELREKVQGAKTPEVSKVTRRPAPAMPRSMTPPPPTRKQGQGLPPRAAVSGPQPTGGASGPSVPPAGVAWNAAVSDSTGVHARRGLNGSVTSRPPPGPSSSTQGTVPPPVSTPRVVDSPTPVPELLRSRRSR
ncbi:MAG TPA: hypothetical protein VGI39_26305 [Polyangiaceae bacterium]